MKVRRWAEMVFSGEADAALLSRAVSAGRLRRLAQGVYTSEVDTDPSPVVRRHWRQILEHELPGAVIADRSVRWGGPDPNGVLTVVHGRWRPLALPGLTVLSRRGEPDPETDTPFGEGLWIRSPARTMLESLAGRSSHHLTRAELEDWIGQIISTQGEQRINRIRDEARNLAATYGRDAGFAKLERLISAALTTGDASDLVTPDLKARAVGRAIDVARVDLLGVLANELSELAPEPLPALPVDEPRRRLLPFYEAYFSNFIEGTEFTVDEAAEIVFKDHIPVARPADAHDIVGTHRVVSDDGLMSVTPSTADELIELLVDRHRVILEGRPESNPGHFKTRPNRAGGTVFVMPDAVEGTLRVGFDLAASIIDPFARAAYLMFLVAEVHPFTDGNGRVARVMMNAELVHGGEVRLLIPIVYRNNYIAALKAATNNTSFAPLIAVLQFAQRYTARIDFSTRESADRDLERTNAFRDPDEADDYGIRLQMP